MIGYEEKMFILNSIEFDLQNQFFLYKRERIWYLSGS